METASLEPEYNDIVFMSVHCRKHTTFCVNKAFANRIRPSAELYYINEEDKIELMDMANKHRSKEGIRNFFESSGIMQQFYDPAEILEKKGRRMLEYI